MDFCQTEARAVRVHGLLTVDPSRHRPGLKCACDAILTLQGIAFGLL